MPEAYIYDHVRTPRGRGKADGALHEVTALALATVPLQALKERNDPPDLVTLVETDGGPFYAWAIRNETGIRLRDGYYTEGDI